MHIISGELSNLHQSANATNSYCPDSHFMCPRDSFCLPVFVRCNGVYDCSGKEDEMGCENAVCPGYYRCRSSAVCVHLDHICDKTFQCPQRDDELLCNFSCPSDCTCLGLTFKCVSIRKASNLPDRLRALDVSGSNAAITQLLHISMLVYLDLSNCRVKDVGSLAFSNMRTLSLSQNMITDIPMYELARMPNLKDLKLSNNPIVSLFSDDHNTPHQLAFLRKLDLSNVQITHLNLSTFDVFPNLQNLNLTGCGIKRVTAPSLGSLSNVQVVDLRGSVIVEFPPTLLQKLHNLREMYSDNYKLCCSQVLPTDFNLRDCHAPASEISSCNNLLRSNVYRLFLAVFAAIALSGNASSLLLRMCLSTTGKGSGYSVLVTHLCISDGLMGIYLVVIGVADKLYENSYLWEDRKWRSSVVCKSSGFVALLSTEMSAFIILLITLDRFLVVRFPFSRLRFQRGSAHAVCCILWVAISVLVSVPFFPRYAHWGFYSHTDICMPLPITLSSFAGHSYAFGVMIVLNMVLFLAIAAGQTAVYMAIRSNTMFSSESSRKRQDLDIARRLISVALTDFLCWFPVGLLGVLAKTGTPVSGEMNVAMATLIMPLNSAMNPFLYTVNVLLEKRRLAKEERIMKYLTAQSQKA